MVRTLALYLHNAALFDVLCACGYSAVGAAQPAGAPRVVSPWRMRLLPFEAVLC